MASNRGLKMLIPTIPSGLKKPVTFETIMATTNTMTTRMLPAIPAKMLFR